MQNFLYHGVDDVICMTLLPTKIGV